MYCFLPHDDIAFRHGNSGTKFAKSIAKICWMRCKKHLKLVVKLWIPYQKSISNTRKIFSLIFWNTPKTGFLYASLAFLFEFFKVDSTSL